jgi:hypothetical protein
LVWSWWQGRTRCRKSNSQSPSTDSHLTDW